MNKEMIKRLERVRRENIRKSDPLIRKMMKNLLGTAPIRKSDEDARDQECESTKGSHVLLS